MRAKMPAFASFSIFMFKNIEKYQIEFDYIGGKRT